MIRSFVFALLFSAPVFAAQPLVVISVDGLDNRYLAEADQRGLKIPTLRRLMREGQYSRGVVGVVPTITWPSHTTILTGVDPVVHGILSNWRPPGDRYLDYSQIKCAQPHRRRPSDRFDYCGRYMARHGGRARGLEPP